IGSQSPAVGEPQLEARARGVACDRAYVANHALESYVRGARMLRAAELPLRILPVESPRKKVFRRSESQPPADKFKKFQRRGGFGRHAGGWDIQWIGELALGIGSSTRVRARSSSTTRKRWPCASFRRCAATIAPEKPAPMMAIVRGLAARGIAVRTGRSLGSLTVQIR